MQKWDIFCVNQVTSRSATEPPQPEDPSLYNRFYLVISPDTHLKSGGSATILPIKTAQGNKILSIPVDPSNDNRLAHTSYIYCNQIYTIPQKYLESFKGVLDNHLRIHVVNALKRYLEI